MDRCLLLFINLIARSIFNKSLNLIIRAKSSTVCIFVCFYRLMRKTFTLSYHDLLHHYLIINQSQFIHHLLLCFSHHLMNYHLIKYRDFTLPNDLISLHFIIRNAYFIFYYLNHLIRL